MSKERYPSTAARQLQAVVRRHRVALGSGTTPYAPHEHGGEEEAGYAGPQSGRSKSGGGRHALNGLWTKSAESPRVKKRERDAGANDGDRGLEKFASHAWGHHSNRFPVNRSVGAG
jgi:hypothetical protein